MVLHGKVYEQRAEGSHLLLQQQCNWVPGTPAKDRSNLIDLNKIIYDDDDRGDPAVLESPLASIEPQVLGNNRVKESQLVEFLNLSPGLGETHYNELLLLTNSDDKIHTSSPESSVSPQNLLPVEASRLDGNGMCLLASSDLLRKFDVEWSVADDREPIWKCRIADVQQNVQHRVEVVVQKQEDEVANLKKEVKRGPKQKPKRKKYRPRVVVDGKPKPKKTPQPKTSKKPWKDLQPKTPMPEPPTCANETKTQKRKCSRKNVKEKLADGDAVEKSVSKKRKCARGNSRSNPNSIILLPPPVPTKTCRQALNFDLENESTDEKAIVMAISECDVRVHVDECSITEATPESEVPVDESVGTRKECGYRKPRSKRRRRLNTVFMSNIPICQVHCPRHKKRRLRRATRRCNLNLLTAIPICSQLPKLPSKHVNPCENATSVCSQLPELPPILSANSEKEDVAIIYGQVAPSETATPIFSRPPELTPKLVVDTEIIFEPRTSKNMCLINNLESSIGSGTEIDPFVPVDLELHGNKSEGTPSKNEGFPLINNLTGISQDIKLMKHPIEVENCRFMDQTIGLEKVSLEPEVHLAVGSQRVLEEPGVSFYEDFLAHGVFPPECLSIENMGVPPLFEEQKNDLWTPYFGPSSAVLAPFPGDSTQRVSKEPGVSLHEGFLPRGVFPQEFLLQEKVGAPPLVVQQKNDSRTPYFGHGSDVLAHFRDHSTDALKILEESGVAAHEGFLAHGVFPHKKNPEENMGTPPFFLESKNDLWKPDFGQFSGVQTSFSGQRTSAMEILPQQDIGFLRFPDQIVAAVEPFLIQSNGSWDLFPRQVINSQEMHSSEFLGEQIMYGLDQLQKQKIGPSSQQVLQEQNLVIQRESLEPENLRLTAKPRGSQELIQMGRNKLPPRHSTCSQVEMMKQKLDSKSLVPCGMKEKPKKVKGYVDLEPNTLRMWNLVMNIDDGETKDLKDEEMEKWMQKEREIFGGRIKSFTAKTHLILGDRRFKPWKGSIVDSVVGAFLTQNTTDFLSSSAFMSVASRFPLRSSNNHTSSEKNLRVTDGRESLGTNSRSDGAVYDPVGNMYYVTQPEPDRFCDDVVASHTFSTCSIQSLQRSQLSPKLKKTADVTPPSKPCGMEISQYCPTCNLKADVAASTKTCCVTCVESSITASSEIPHLENTTVLLDDGKIDKIVLCDEGLDECPKPIMMDNGRLASTSRRNEMKSDFGCTSLSNFNDPFAFSVSSLNQESSSTGIPQYHNTTTKSKGSTKEKVPNLEESMSNDVRENKSSKKKVKKKEQQDWDLLRRIYSNGAERSPDQTDSVDWEAVRCAEESEIAHIIEKRGQYNNISRDIKKFLNRIVELHGSIDLEWLRNVPPDKVKEYLMDIKGIGLKSTECIRLLSLQHVAFPVDVNVARIAVRLGWVPLQPLPGDLHIHLIEEYPVQDKIQKYLWPRLCVFDQKTLYELHYQMITFGKVFCKKGRKPNCNACPLKGECKHFANASASGMFALPGPSEKGIVASEIGNGIRGNPSFIVNPTPVIPLEADPVSIPGCQMTNCEPIVEEPRSPEPECAEPSDSAVDDDFIQDIEDIPTFRLQETECKEDFKNLMEVNKIMLQESNALVPLTVEAASRSVRKLKKVSRLRTEHVVYELPDDHPILLQGRFERRDPDDQCPYFLAIWSPGDTPESVGQSQYQCNYRDSKLCDSHICYRCNNVREVNAGIVRGTILIPCRTANRGRFPLNGTYFQVNEVFADNETSYCPINVPRHLIANLPRRVVCFGTSVSEIFKGLPTSDIQFYFWAGFICVRGFDRSDRGPRPLSERLHRSTSYKKAKNKR